MNKIDKKLKPCPFCGSTTKIQIVNNEGNFHNEDYKNDPWSGLEYVIIHNTEENEDCPIAKYEGEIMGSYMYDTEEEAIQAWNRRYKDEIK